MTIKKYQPASKKHLKGLAVLATCIVKNLIEFELGALPIDKMEDELYEMLEDWIDEVDSEKELAFKIETGGFGSGKDGTSKKMS